MWQRGYGYSDKLEEKLFYEGLRTLKYEGKLNFDRKINFDEFVHVLPKALNERK